MHIDLCMLVATLTLPSQLCGCSLLTSVLVCIQGLQSGHLVTQPGQLCLCMYGPASCVVVVHQPLCRILD